MKRSEVYRKAAKWLEKQRPDFYTGCCMALEVADCHQHHIEELEDFIGRDAMDAGPRRMYWRLNFSDAADMNEQLEAPHVRQAHSARVLALCFMAAITSPK